ncbi:MAG: TetR/AcrR family transcriptional regulator [Candidatus Muiribacteriota bacterium]
MKKEISVKQLILNAAEEVTMEHGASNMTLNAVAKKAGISKGGLLYHFPSKDELIKGMISHMIEEQFEIMKNISEKLPDTPSNKIKSNILMWCHEPEKRKHFHAVIIAILSYNPEIIDPFKEIYSNLMKEFSKGMDPVMIKIISLASMGLMLSDVFNARLFTDKEQKEITDKLFELADKAIIKEEE